MEKDEKPRRARYPCPFSNIIEEVGNKIFNYLFLNEDLDQLKSCQATAQKYLK